MKKTIIFIVLVMLVLSLVSCGTVAPETADSEKETEAPSTEAPTTETPATEASETEAPEVVEGPDEYSVLNGVTSTADEGVYSLNFANGRTVKFDASAAKIAYEAAVAKGFAGDFARFLGFSVNDAKSKLYYGTEIGAAAFGKALAVMLEHYADYFVVNDKAEPYEVVVVASEGYIKETGQYGANSSTQTYRYTQKIKVAEGQVFELVSGGKNLAMRFATAYKNGAASAEDSMIDAGCYTTRYVIPAGVNEVVATFKAADGEVVARITGTGEVKPTLRNRVDSDTLAELMGGEYALSAPTIMTTKETLKDRSVSLGGNHVMNNKRLTLTFEIDQLHDGEVISLGHGEKEYGASVLEITKTHLRSYYYTNKQEEYLNTAHGIEISGKITVTIRVGFGLAEISIANETDKFVTGEFHWGGRNGEIFAKSVGAEMKNVTLSWWCFDLKQEIWLFGDSYFNMTDLSRWPTYMLDEGYTEYLLTGYPGRMSKDALADFKELLDFGTPKYAVWCMGMNDKDTANGVNAAWKAATEEFIAICDEKGIIPILATIPNTPTNINSFKNEIVLASGCRYIDFATAVDGNEQGSPWTSGMLSSDKVHPAKPGAKALWEQVKKDLPEILK